MSTPSKGMIFLDTGHPIIEKVFRDRLVPDSKREPLDVKVSDFDDVSYHIKAGKEDNVVELAMNMKVLEDIQTTVKPYLRSKYGPYLKSENKKEVVLAVDLSSVSEAESEGVVRLVSNLKRNTLGAPLESAFQALAEKKKSTPLVINYRKTEQIVLAPLSDRINVVVSVDFVEETDANLADIFMSEFTEAGKKNPQAPNVSYSIEQPSEIKKIKGVRKQQNEIGYMMFQMFAPHVADERKREQAISLVLGMRGYLMYHIKAAKAQMHERMRTRVKSLLQLLNRAKTVQAESKKKNFRRLE